MVWKNNRKNVRGMIDMLEYIKLFYEHQNNEEPVIILYEVNLDDERLAMRSIDIFADGHTNNIDDLYDGVIEILPIPTVEEFNMHIWGEEFNACCISQAEFEAIWTSHFYDGDMQKQISKSFDTFGF